MRNAIAIQFHIIWENKAANFDKISSMLEHSFIEPGSLIVLPEMFATGFSMNTAAIAEAHEGETAHFLCHLAQKTQSFILGGIVSPGPDSRCLNQSVVFEPSGNEIARYSKMHPFTLGGEPQYYAPGHQIVTFSWHEFTVAPFVCYDVRFPEIFRHAMQRGVGLFTIIASWPQSRTEQWMSLLRARAIENQAYVIGVNRCGRDPNLPYSGRSQIIDPWGNILADAGNAEGIIQADLDPDYLRAYRQDFPFLQDIREEYRWD